MYVSFATFADVARRRSGNGVVFMVTFLSMLLYAQVCILCVIKRQRIMKIKKNKNMIIIVKE